MARASGFVLAIVLLALGACQTSQVVMNGPLPRNAAGEPIYAPGYALKDMLREPASEI